MVERVKVFTCQECSSVFADQTLLDYHVLCHNEQQKTSDMAMSVMTYKEKVVLDRVPIYECPECTRGFLSDWDYHYHKIQHQKQKHNKTYKFPNKTDEDDDNDDSQYRKIYSCEDCEARFVLYSTLLAHSVLHKPFEHTCHCGVGYYKEKDLHIHQKLVHNESQNNPGKPIWKPKINLSTDTIMRTKPKKPRPKLGKIEANGDTDVNQPLTIGSTNTNGERYRKPTYLTPGKSSEAPTSSVQYKDDDDLENISEVDDVSEDETYEPSSVKKGPRIKGELVYKKPVKKRMKISNEEKVYQCNDCTMIYKTAKSLRYHIKVSHSGDRPFKCDECGKCYASQIRLEGHKNYKHGANYILVKKEKTHACTFCNKALSSSGALKSHMMIHTGETRYQCEVCGKKFISKIHYKQCKMRHLGNRYPCPTCGKEFTTPYYLECHKRIHLEVKPFVCAFCERGFADPSALARHERLHTGHKPYQCPFCPKRFSDASAHIVHRKRHTEERNYQCDTCQKSFFVRSALKNHVTVAHSDPDRNFECDFCQKTFVFKSQIAFHMNVSHMKTKKKKCKYCPKKFAPFYMKSHLHKDHGVHRLPAVKRCHELVKNEM